LQDTYPAAHVYDERLDEHGASRGHCGGIRIVLVRYCSRKYTLLWRQKLDTYELVMDGFEEEATARCDSLRVAGAK
jgi:hypothetical protein